MESDADPVAPGGVSECMLRTVLDEHTDYICLVSGDGRIRWANAALTRLFGWPIDEIVGGDAFALIHPDDLERLRNAYAASLAHPGQRYAVEFRLRCKDSSWRMVESAGTNLLGDPSIGAIIVSTRDITDRKHAEAALAAQRDDLDRQLRYAQSLRRMSDAIASLEEPRAVLDMLVREMGETLRLDRCLLFDVDRERDLAAGVSQWLNQANPEAFSIISDYPLEVFRESWKHLWNTRTPIVSHADAMSEPLVKEGSAPYCHGELKIRSLLWHPFCFRVDGFFMIALNQVSSRRHWRPDEVVFVEAASTQVNLALQKRRIVAERTLVEEQLRQSQKMEAIGRLAGGIAHDFNNLLTAIIGYADLMKDKLPPDHPLHRHVDGILQVANRASATTHQLLSFSRQQVLKPKSIGLNGLVSKLESLLRRLIGENIELVVRLGHDVGRVRMDPGQLELALVNLAVNARDAMIAGGTLTMTTSVCAVDADGAARLRLAVGTYACIVVSDTGVGMDPETLRHLFEPFFTTKELGKGTGLGLSSVYGIVHAAGGGIHVESRLGKGSTFSVYLPLDLAGESTPSGGVQLIPARGGAETILMVEDDDTLRELLGEALIGRGYRVLAAHDGAQALRMASTSGHIDLVLSDVVMPQMNGPTLARELMRIHPGVRLLFMSGYTADAFVGDADLVNVPVITKPFSIDDLARTVREVIDGRARTAR